MSGADWVAFARGEALRAHGVRVFSGDPPGVTVPRTCPNCGRSDRWTRIDVRGESPGRTDVVCANCEHDLHTNGQCQVGDCACRGGVQKLVAIPARKGLAVYRCYDCRIEYRFGDEPFTPEEQAQRTTALWGQAKTGKVPL